MLVTILRKVSNQEIDPNIPREGMSNVIERCVECIDMELRDYTPNKVKLTLYHRKNKSTDPAHTTHILVKGEARVYKMNDEGKTIDKYEWSAPDAVAQIVAKHEEFPEDNLEAPEFDIVEEGFGKTQEGTPPPPEGPPGRQIREGESPSH